MAFVGHNLLFCLWTGQSISLSVRSIHSLSCNFGPLHNSGRHLYMIGPVIHLVFGAVSLEEVSALVALLHTTDATLRYNQIRSNETSLLIHEEDMCSLRIVAYNKDPNARGRAKSTKRGHYPSTSA